MPIFLSVLLAVSPLAGTAAFAAEGTQTEASSYTISGKVDAGETEADVSKIAVNLYASSDTDHQTSLNSATPNEDGTYSFTKKEANGSYVVVVAAAEGSYTESTKNVTVSDADVTDADITLQAEPAQTYTISGKVDAGETEADVSKIAVNLYASNDTDHQTSLDSATTDQDGKYSFATKEAKGTYVVVVAAVEGSYAESKADVTVNDADVIDAVITLQKETPDYTLSIGAESNGGVGYTRTITVGGNGKYLVTAITEGSGDNAKVSVVMFALTGTTASVSYQTKGATVETWIVSANSMPKFTNGAIDGKFDAHATTAD